MTLRAIAVDIDGTVTDYEKILDWDGVTALRAAEARGVPVLVASGNVGPVAKAFASFVGLTGPIVAENGGVVYSHDMRERKLLADRARGEAAYRKLLAAGLPARPLWSDVWRVSEVALELNVSEEDAKRALDGMDVDVVSTRFALHLMQPGLDKWTGILAALPWIRVPDLVAPAEVLTIGDSNNDERMLRVAGASGCVGNGTARAKAAARFVAKASHGAGVAEILRHFRLL